MVTSDFRPEVEIRPFRACAMHPAIIIGTVRSLLTWLWGRYHVPQNAFLVVHRYHPHNIMQHISFSDVQLTDQSINQSVKKLVNSRNCHGVLSIYNSQMSTLSYLTTYH